MKVNETELWLALGGGLLIALAASLHLALKGRITGMSGLISGVLGNEGSKWKISLLVGMAITSCVFWLIFKFDPIGEEETTVFFSTPQKVISGLDIFGFALAGLLVGVGTRLGTGCTSGHGVCGLPRLSIRSYVAVFIFVAFGIGLATLRLYEPFLESTDGLNVISKINYNLIVPLILGGIVVFYLGYIFYLKRAYDELDTVDLAIGFITGVIFASGLIVSGMIKREKVLGFLQIGEDWDPSLLITLAAATIPNFLTFYLILSKPHPVLSKSFEVPVSKKIDSSLIIGALIFGLGWGLGGLCPGPVYVLTPIFTPHISVIFLLSLLTGYYLVMKAQQKNKEKSLLSSQILYSSQLQSGFPSTQFELGNSINRVKQ